MALWKNKEEYENWKIEKIEQAKRTAEELEVKRFRKKKLFICRYCSKEVRRTFLNCIRCPFCKSENPAPPLTKREKYECFYSNHCIYNGDNNSF